MKKEIIVKDKKYTMPKMSISAYMDYIEVRDSVMATESSNGLYTKKQFLQMMESICGIYGNQFTVDDLLSEDSGLSVADVIMEFASIEIAVGEEVERKTDKLTANFTNGAQRQKFRSKQRTKKFTVTK